MNGTSGFEEVQSSTSRSPSDRFLQEQRHQFEKGSWHHFHAPLAALRVDVRLAVRGEGLAGMTLGASLGGETAFLVLRQIAPAWFLTRTFAVDWSAGCTS